MRSTPLPGGRPLSRLHEGNGDTLYALCGLKASDSKKPDHLRRHRRTSEGPSWESHRNATFEQVLREYTLVRRSVTKEAKYSESIPWRPTSSKMKSLNSVGKSRTNHQ